ncbi:hypothetical protein BDZ89DRAFT_961656 [Hymenopellis radicata]|nr:hypothetical protein BDZ89DRAFT_961656 [Hymenopellis radicata]
MVSSYVQLHIINGADISLDIDDASLSFLEFVQVSTLRRILELGTRSSTSVLFTELGLQPLRCRHLILSPAYLKYSVARPPTHHAFLALQVFEDLSNGHHSLLVADLDPVITSSST